MKVVYERCAGADVHKKTVVVCVLTGPAAGPVEQEVRTFGTTTRELLKLADWLAEAGVTHLAMESTGVYWKPVYNVLEGMVEVWLVNAHHVKAVPGRKTDVKDSQWLGELMRHGLVRASFIPPEETRILRELTRYRRTLVRERARQVNRVQKVLEEANIKLASVATDVMGVSGRAMIGALVEGQTDPEKLAGLARGKLRKKKAELAEALEGRVKQHQRLILKELMGHIDYLDSAIDRISREVEDHLRPFDEAIERLDEIPGVDRRTIEDVLAEIGTDMSRFPSAAHLASWAGLCPGNRQSGGKRLGGKTTKGSTWLRAALIQASWAAQNKKNCYFRTQYLRLKGRRGPKKAIVAIAHSLLVTFYEMLVHGTPYTDLGSDHFDRVNKQATARRLTKRLQELGYEVHLKAPAA